MLKQFPQILRTKNIFRSSWIGLCLFIMGIAIATSIFVYIQVSKELTGHIEQRLLWEAKFYCKQLERSILTAALKLEGLVHSSVAISKSKDLVQRELWKVGASLPGFVYGWIAYQDGTLIPAPNTNQDYVRQLPWWREYLLGEVPSDYPGYLLEGSRTILGSFSEDKVGLSVITSLISFDLQGSEIVRAAGMEVDINALLINNAESDVNWSSSPVSVYNQDGCLLVSPFQYQRNLFKPLKDCSSEPLMELQKSFPDKQSGFLIYSRNGHKMAGIFLRVPSLGLILTIELPANEVYDPIRQVATGPLIMAFFSLIITTLFIRTLYIGSRQLLAAELDTRTAEFRALQAHINPHFLFNTLNRMVGLALSSDTQTLVNAIRCFSRILHYTTRNPHILVPLKEELSYLNEYVYLQRIRYGERFAFKLEIPDELLKIKVFKLCIQPLVENCFVHGVERSMDPVTISINIRKIDDYIEISIFDDGPGISGDRLTEINAALEEAESQSRIQGQGIGLLNIHHRVRYTYGKPYGITLEQPKQGLIVRLRLPLLTDD